MTPYLSDYQREIVYARFMQGASVASLAKDFGVDASKIEHAIRRRGR